MCVAAPRCIYHEGHSRNGSPSISGPPGEAPWRGCECNRGGQGRGAQTGSASANAAAMHLGSGVPTAQWGLDGSPELQPPEVSASSLWLCDGGAGTRAVEWGVTGGCMCQRQQVLDEEGTRTTGMDAYGRLGWPGPRGAHLFSTERMAVQAFLSLWASRERVLNTASVRSSS